MQETIKSFLEAIALIKDPLKFWSFYGAILFAIILVVFRYPKLIETLARITGRKVGKTQFFHLVKMSLWFLFIICIVISILAFVAPIVLQKMTTNTSELVEQISAAKGQILGSLELDHKLANAFEHFEVREYEKARSILTELFEQTDRRPSDYLQGYVVATYYGAKDYETAAREVLRRDRNNPSHDFSLWKDINYCIRQYTLKNSFPAGLSLVDKLRQEFGPKLVSPVWVAFPLNILPYLREGSHSRSTIEGLTEDQRRDLKYVVQKYPKAPFIEFALYALGRYDQAFAESPKSLIKDVIMYARAYESVARLRFSNDSVSIGLPAQGKVLQQLSDFVKAFPSSPHADDAAVWSGWLAWQQGKIEKALRWFKASTVLGNRDYQYEIMAWEFQNRMLGALSSDSLFSILTTSTNLIRPTYLWYRIVRDYHFSHNYNQARTVAMRALASIVPHSEPVDVSTKTQSSQPTQNQEIDEATLAYDPDAIYRSRLSYFIQAADLVQTTQKLNSVFEFKRIGNLFRNHFNDYVTAIYMYDEGIRRFPGSKITSNLMFLKVLVYRDWEPTSVAAAVSDLLTTFPNSKYCDDALAELAFVQLTIQWDVRKGEQTVHRLLRKYPNKNACDNALNWLAYWYAIDGETEKASSTYQEIIRRFPRTRFAGYAHEYFARYTKSSDKTPSQ